MNTRSIHPGKAAAPCGRTGPRRRPPCARRLLTVQAWLCVLTGPVVAQSAFVQENPEAFFATGSQGAATRVHHVDKATGQVRTGVVNGATGEIAWEGPFSSGVENTTGAALWRTSAGTGVDLLALTSPAHNRVEMPPTATTDAVGYTVTGVVGPSLLAGLDPAASTGTHFVLASVENDAPTPLQISAYGVLNDVTSTLASPDVPRAANRVKLKTGAASRGALIVDGRVQVAAISGAGALSFPTGFTVPSPATARWTYGWFKNEALEPRSQFIDFTPGESTFRLHQVTEPTANNFSFAAPVSFTLGGALEQLSVVQIAGTPRLVAVFLDGSAALYDFNGVAAPVLKASYSAPPDGYRFGLTAGGGRLALLTDNDWRVFEASGASPSTIPIASGALPALRPRAAAQNAFITQGEPFADPAARLTGGGQYDEWTSDPATPDGQPRPLTAPVLLRGDRFAGELDGLVLATPSRVVAAQGAGRFLLPNQHTPDASVASFGSSAQNLRPDVTFSPAPGNYAPALAQSGDTGGDPAAAVTVRLVSTQGTTVYYRINAADAWTAYDPGSPLAVYTTQTIEARTSGSAIRRGTYTVAVQNLSVPPVTDADLNGLADGWEQLFGLSDPNADPDGDGANNLTEQNAGTDPLDPLSSPGTTPLEQVFLTSSTSPDGNTLTLTWPANIGPVVLQRATSLSSWAPVVPQPSGNTYSTPINTQRDFFRLVRP